MVIVNNARKKPNGKNQQAIDDYKIKVNVSAG
jgi:hypothetical protein